MIWQIIAPHFAAGISFEGGVVTDTAPIVRYMRGWSARSVTSYCAKKGWDINTNVVRAPKTADELQWAKDQAAKHGLK